MRNFLNTIITSFICVSSFIAVATYSSCNNNPCKDIVCKNNGTCREGKCACPSGYEGVFCGSKESDKFVGYYDGFIRKNGEAPVNLTIIISPGSKGNEMLIYDLYKTYITQPLIVNIKETVKFDLPLVYATTPPSQYRGNGYVETGKYMYFWYEHVNTSGILETYYYEGTKRIVP